MAQVIKDIKNWVADQSCMNRSPEEAYQAVCDFYQNYTSRLTDVSLSIPELRICKPVAAVLQYGINTCPTWVSSSQYMKHYSELTKAVKAAEEQFKSISYLSSIPLHKRFDDG